MLLVSEFDWLVLVYPDIRLLFMVIAMTFCSFKFSIISLSVTLKRSDSEITSRDVFKVIYRFMETGIFAKGCRDVCIFFKFVA